jgi:hypothetical protein
LNGHLQQVPFQNAWFITTEMLWQLDQGVAGSRCDSTLVLLVFSHEDVALVSPLLAPAARLDTALDLKQSSKAKFLSKYES